MQAHIDAISFDLRGETLLMGGGKGEVSGEPVESLAPGHHHHYIDIRLSSGKRSVIHNLYYHMLRCVID